MILDLDGNNIKQSALTEDGLRVLVNMSFVEDPFCIYSNDQALNFLTNHVTIAITIPKEEVTKVLGLKEYDKYKAKLEALFRATSITCKGLVDDSCKVKEEGVE